MNLHYLNMLANFYAKFSPDSETKVGAIVSEDLGAFNSFVDLYSRNLPTTRPNKYEYILHAEVKLVCRAAELGISLKDQVVFCTLSPCKNCMRVLYSAGVRVIVYRDRYRDHSIDMADLKITETKYGDFTRIDMEPVLT